jgi:sulfite reductase (ferredoxin)
MGWEKFQRMVLKERSIVEMTTAISTAKLFDVNDMGRVNQSNETTLSHSLTKLPVINDNVTPDSTKYERWLRTNVVPQKQDGYFTVFVTLEAGDITANQLRTLAGTIRELSFEGVARNTPQQNFAIRYIKGEDLEEFHDRLMAIGLGGSGALTITSAVGCSGTTSCNLAITNSHRLAKEVQRKFLEMGYDTDEELRDSTIKVSGCPNSCGQHEIATIGFFGGASRIGNSMAPTYTMLFGGSAGENGELGKTIMRVPARKVIDTIKEIIKIYKNEMHDGQTLNQWITRVVKGEGTGQVRNVEDMKRLLIGVTQLPPVESEPELYKDYGNDVKFTAKTARGECAA